jgi:HlyD family secretion protein
MQPKGSVMARRWWKVLMGAAFVILAGGAGFAFTQFRPLTVQVRQSETNVAIKVFGLGTVEARVVTRIGFKVAGTLTELRVDHGDRVAAGQLLAQIDPREQKARVAKARAQLLSAEAAVRVAEAASRKATTLTTQRTKVNQRRQALLARQSVSVEAAEDAEHNEAVARADLLVAETEIEAAKARLDDARAQHDFETVVLNQHELRAPFAGVIALRAKELGAVIGAGEALFTLVAPETMWILAYVDEARAGDIEEGQPVEVRLRSLPQQTFRGRVSRIGIESDRVNEERRIYVSCENCPEAFYLGEQAEVFITTAVLPRALMIPEASIAEFDGTSGLVWTVEDGRLHRRKVTLGKRALDGRIEIRAGLADGAVVPATVASGFREGRSVRVSPDGTP